VPQFLKITPTVDRDLYVSVSAVRSVISEYNVTTDSFDVNIRMLDGTTILGLAADIPTVEEADALTVKIVDAFGVIDPAGFLA
jgi:hypothetical protein